MPGMLLRSFVPSFFTPVCGPRPRCAEAMLSQWGVNYEDEAFTRKAGGAENITAQLPSSITTLRSSPALAAPGCLLEWERWNPICKATIRMVFCYLQMNTFLILYMIFHYKNSRMRAKSCLPLTSCDLELFVTVFFFSCSKYGVHTRSLSFLTT